MGKLVAAALPMKAGTATSSAASKSTVSKAAVSKTAVSKNGSGSANGANGGAVEKEVFFLFRIDLIYLFVGMGICTVAR